MTKREALATEYHERGFSCSQSVLAAFSDLTGLSEQQSMSLAGGFGRGAGTGELCGALTGAVLVLGYLTPADLSQPAISKKRSVALAREVQEAFLRQYGALRCEELLGRRKSGAVKAGCGDFVATAVALTEQLLAEHK